MTGFDHYKFISDQADYTRALRKLNRWHSVPKPFKAWLLRQGPQAVKAFTNAGYRRRRRMVASWKRLIEQRPRIERMIERLPEALEKLPDKPPEIDL